MQVDPGRAPLITDPGAGQFDIATGDRGQGRYLLKRMPDSPLVIILGVKKRPELDLGQRQLATAPEQAVVEAAILIRSHQPGSGNGRFDGLRIGDFAILGFEKMEPAGGIKEIAGLEIFIDADSEGVAFPAAFSQRKLGEDIGLWGQEQRYRYVGDQHQDQDDGANNSNTAK